MKIAMHDDDCIEDISREFGEFCRKNGRVTAQRMGKFLAARLLFGTALDEAGEGGGAGGGTVADTGSARHVCRPEWQILA